ncbi:MAG: AI-2E family transporter [Clostridia bacterium]|nr:AI-2E family transporter [Clostridia bacterium]
MKFEWKNCFKVCLSVFVLFLCITYWSLVANVISKVAGALIPILIGFIIAYVINILMSFYERKAFYKIKNQRIRKLKRPLCLTGAIFTLIAIIALIISLVLPQLISCIRLIASMLPGAIEDLINYFEVLPVMPKDITDFLKQIDMQKLMTQAAEIVTTGVGGVMDVVVKMASSVFSGTITTFLSIIFAIYLLIGKDSLIRKTDMVFKHYVPEKIRNRVCYVLNVFNECFHKYIVGQCIEAVILGGLCTVGMIVLRLPYATMIGALVAFTALIPVAGAYIGALVGAFMILTVSPLKALVFLIFLVILQQLEGNIIYPKVVGNSIGLPSILVLAAVTVGGGVLGIAGMLLGVPITAAVYKIIKDDMNKGRV